MGYTIKIGEATIERDEEYVRIGVKPEMHDEAPAHGDPTDYTNERWPSYSSWAEAMRSLGLAHVMFNERNGGGDYWREEPLRGPLLDEHPGVVGITIEHVEEVERVIAAYREKFPTRRAEYPPVKTDAKPVIEGSKLYRDEDYVTDTDYDSSLCRGEWLAYWLRWAVENCENPVFVNT